MGCSCNVPGSGSERVGLKSALLVDLANVRVTERYSISNHNGGLVMVVFE